MSKTLDTDFLNGVLTQLKRVGATVDSDRDDHGNPYITIKGSGEYPVVARHSVIGGEEIVVIDEKCSSRSCPGPNGDPFGPIDDATAEIEQLWPLVTAVFPDATV